MADTPADPVPADAAPAARVIEGLLDEGELVDDGAFTLDPAAAAAKLAAYQHADRSRYLVALAEGLFRLGADRIDLDGRLTSLVITATGVDLSEPEAGLADLYAYGLGGGEDPRALALARLAVALDMVLGSSEQVRAELRYTPASGPSRQVLAEYHWGQAPRLSESPGSDTAPGTLAIELRDDRSLRSQALAKLGNAVRFSEREVLVDGERISKTPRTRLEVLTGHGPGYQVHAWLEPGGEPSTVEIWAAGVCVGWITGEGRGFRAALEPDLIRRDLSRMKVIRDATIEQALVTIEQLRQQALAQLEALDQVWAREGWPPEWPPEQVDRALGRPIRMHLAGREIVVEPLDAFALMRRHSRGGSPGLMAAVLMLVAFWPLLMAVLTGRRGFRLDRADDLLNLLVFVFFFAIVLFYVVAMGLLIFAPRAAYRAVRARERGVQTRARVTGTDLGSRPKPSQRKFVCVEWELQDRDGATHEGRSLPRDPSEAQKWRVGEEITVYYDPDDPSFSVWEADVGPRLR